jgi:O-antigen ligase
MSEPAIQNTLVRTLSIGAPLVTVFLLVGSVTDPVNAPKLFLLGGVAGAAIAVALRNFFRSRESLGYFEYALLFFTTWGAVAAFKSDSPLSQNIYGVYGRNTGWLTYLLLTAIALSASRLRGKKNFEKVLVGFLVAVGVNIAYSLWVLKFGDFVGWNNNYGAILGTFGNPNFISSFLGMAFSGVLALAIAINRKARVFAALILPVIAWQIIKADSLQGVVIAAVGTWLVGFFWLRGKFAQNWISGGYFSAGLLTGSVGILGALGHGPLKQALAQPTVALREQYWLAAWHMAKSHPIFGVGMDSYGDWYRRARGAQALITPGPDTVTNVSHNVFLDLLAYGGFPLLIAYLVFIAIGLISVIRVVLRIKNYDPIFITLAIIWVCYLAQSIISINQIGLAIWGWLLTGLLVAYEIDSRNKVGLMVEGKRNLKKSKVTAEAFSPQLLAFIGMIIGLLISIPPLSADMKWRKVQTSGQVNQLESALSGSYMSPKNSYTLASAVELLENSKLPDLAIKYAREGVAFNPNFLDAWKMLYYATKSTPDEKAKAKSEMIRLDPLNPEWNKLA